MTTNSAQLAAEDQTRTLLQDQIEQQGYVLLARSTPGPHFACAVVDCTVPAADELHVFTKRHLDNGQMPAMPYAACRAHLHVLMEGIEERYGNATT